MESFLDLISEVSRSEGACNRSSLSGSRKLLKHNSLARVLGGYDFDISGVFNGNIHKLLSESLSCSLQIYNVDAITFPFVDVFIWKSRLEPPKWIPAARNLRTPFSFIFRTLRAPDIVQVSLTVTMETQDHAIWTDLSLDSVKR